MRLAWTVLATLGILALSAPARGDTFEPNDTLGEAYGPLQSGVPIQSYISSPGDVDWYTFDADLGALTLTLTGIPAGTDYDLFLTDEVGNIYAQSDSSGNQDERIEEQVTGPGPFWVRVVSVSGYAPESPYTLTAVFTPRNESPTVALLSPNGGETFFVGDSVTVSWTASDPEDGTDLAVDLAYSADAGTTWTALVSTTENSGSWGWTVPGPVTAEALVRVTVTDEGGKCAADTSDGFFAVAEASPPPELALSLPSDLATAAGESLDVPVTFESNVPLASLTFGLAYDPELLTPYAVAAGPRAGPVPLQTDTTAAGLVRIQLVPSPPDTLASGTGVLCTVGFRTATAPAGNGQLGFPEAFAVTVQGDTLDVTAGRVGVTPVETVALRAESAREGILLVWTVSGEDAGVGFLVLREEPEGPVTPVSPLLPAGARSYLDRTARAGTRYRYWLEAWRRDGSVRRFGPVDGEPLAVSLWLGPARPNPSRGPVRFDLRLAPGRRWEAAVLDLAGRRVRRVVPSADGVLFWDGRDEAGRETPAGIYFVRVRAGATVRTRRVVRLAP